MSPRLLVCIAERMELLFAKMQKNVGGVGFGEGGGAGTGSQEFDFG